jgi:hypothetical protein
MKKKIAHNLFISLNLSGIYNSPVLYNSEY